MDKERVNGERVVPDDRKRGGDPVVVHHDWEGADGVAVTVAQAVAEAWTGDPRDAMSLPPVGSAIDVDALQRLFASLPRDFVDRPNGDGAEPATVRFGYVGYDVTVRQDGLVTVEDSGC